MRPSEAIGHERQPTGSASAARRPPRRRWERGAPKSRAGENTRAVTARKSKSKAAKAQADESDVGAARARIAELSDALRRHDALYYQDDAPEISDPDYDGLRRE